MQAAVRRGVSGMRAMRLFGALIVLGLLAGCGEPVRTRIVERAGTLETAPKLDPERARHIINAYRAREGLKPLTLDPKLAAAAREHSQDLARHDQISHKGTDGSTPWSRVEKSGYRAQLAAENVAVGQITLEEVIKDWQDSPSHNANLLQREATQMGIALVFRPDTKYRSFWTLVLGSPI